MLALATRAVVGEGGLSARRRGGHGLRGLSALPRPAQGRRRTRARRPRDAARRGQGHHRRQPLRDGPPRRDRRARPDVDAHGGRAGKARRRGALACGAQARHSSPRSIRSRRSASCVRSSARATRSATSATGSTTLPRCTRPTSAFRSTRPWTSPARAPTSSS